MDALHLRSTHISPLRIPPEILIDIIDEVANGWPMALNSFSSGLISFKWHDESKAYPCERLCDYMLVSVLWYHTIINAPRLWTKTRLDATTKLGPVKELQLLNHCLARSGGNRLDITLAGRSNNQHDLVLPTLLRACDRWHILTICPNFEHDLLRDGIRTPQLEILHVPGARRASFQITAESVKTIILRGDGGANYDLAAFEQNIGQYPKVSSLSCTGIMIPNSDKYTWDLPESGLPNFAPLPNLVNLVLIDCKLGDSVAVNLLRASPALKSLPFHITDDQKFGSYWGTLICTTVERLEILPDLWERHYRSSNLIALLSSVSCVETIYWRDFSASVGTLLHALKPSTFTGAPLVPKLRNLEFEDSEINREIFVSLRQKRRAVGVQDGDIRNALRITIHKCKDNKIDTLSLPRAEFMTWVSMDLDKVYSTH